MHARAPLISPRHARTEGLDDGSGDVVQLDEPVRNELLRGTLLEVR